MSEDMNEMDVNGKCEDGARQAPPDNPLTEDPRRVDSGRDLARRIADVVDDLEWRQIARDRQATAISILEDLKRPASARAAEGKALDERQVARTVPDSAATAKALLGRLLIKCEDAVGELFRERDLHRFGLVGQLAHASARLVAMLDQVDRGAPAPQRPRKVRGSAHDGNRVRRVAEKARRPPWQLQCAQARARDRSGAREAARVLSPAARNRVGDRGL